MQNKVGIIRNGKDLAEAVEDLKELEAKLPQVKAHGSSQYNPGWHEAISLHSLIVTSKLVANAALLREESRGGHTRLDFEGEREEWSKYNIVVRKGKDGEVEIEKVERSAPDPELERIARSSIEDLDKEVAAEKGL